jgi:predicted metalloprotease
MRWDESHESRDVIDRRGEGPVRGGGLGGNPGGLINLAFFLLTKPHGWVIVVIGLAFYLARGLFFSDGGVSHRAQGEPVSTTGGPAETAEVHFMSFVLDDVQATWEKNLAQSARPYRHAKLVLYTDSTRTGCGIGEAATGPFYCPEDERVYLDLGFFHELSGRLGARGQFAQAYVLAHEVGHHVQKILGIAGDDSTRGATGASVRFELQADCFAGIWARSTQERQLLEAGDIGSAIGAAQSVGDDRLQRMATGTVSPERWTHGSSAERARWFQRGMSQAVGASLSVCDTFSAKTL